MLIVFIIIQLTFEVLWLRSYSIELVKQTRFSHLRLTITINSHILLGAQLFTDKIKLYQNILRINGTCNAK